MNNKAFLGQKYFDRKNSSGQATKPSWDLKASLLKVCRRWQKSCHGMSADSNQCGRRGQWKWLITQEGPVHYQSGHTLLLLPLVTNLPSPAIWLLLQLFPQCQHRTSFILMGHTKKAERKDRSLTIFSIKIIYSGLKRFVDALAKLEIYTFCCIDNRISNIMINTNKQL